ncbi:pentapeptide repeat-containing protein [Sorangium sp. So ce887]|uniref:pentapeptide repeat-containing protein n=1 Tax=Sorangium sp. So ce887 TaxID=3133324 RepID=UPI003F63B904
MRHPRLRHSRLRHSRLRHSRLRHSRLRHSRLRHSRLRPQSRRPQADYNRARFHSDRRRNLDPSQTDSHWVRSTSLPAVLGGRPRKRRTGRGRYSNTPSCW